MAKRKFYSFLAICTTVIFSLVYFLVFSRLDVSSGTDVEVIPSPSAIQVEGGVTQVYWLQLGVFSNESSYTQLVQECSELGLNPYVVISDEQHILVIGVCTSEQELQIAQEIVSIQGYEYMAKQADITDQNQIDLLKTDKITQVLQEVAYR